MKFIKITSVRLLILSMVFIACGDSETINNNTADIVDNAGKTSINELSDFHDESEREVNIGNSILYILYEAEGDQIAVPIVLFQNGKYIAPAYCQALAIEEEAIIECKRAKKYFSPFVQKGSKLYLINNGKRSVELNVQGEFDYGLSDWTRPSAILQKFNFKGRLLTNNPNLGTNKLISLSDRPKLPKRKREDQYDENGKIIEPATYYSDNLIDFVDINGDGTPELVYECDDYEGDYYVIYSKLNGVWKKVFEGAYNGV